MATNTRQHLEWIFELNEMLMLLWTVCHYSYQLAKHNLLLTLLLGTVRDVFMFFFHLVCCCLKDNLG